MVKHMKRFLKERKHEKKGFTLVELVIVILIISILAVVLIPQLSSMVNKAKTSGVNEDFHEFQLAAQTVMYENSGLPEEGEEDAGKLANLSADLNKNLDNTNKIVSATASTGKLVPGEVGTADFTEGNLNATLTTDPWGNAYLVEVVENGVKFTSAGADQDFGLGDDVKVGGASDNADVEAKADDNLTTTIQYVDGSVKTATDGFSMDAK